MTEVTYLERLSELKIEYINEVVRFLIDYIYEHIFAELNEFTLLSDTSTAKRMYDLLLIILQKYTDINIIVCFLV